MNSVEFNINDYLNNNEGDRVLFRSNIYWLQIFPIFKEAYQNNLVYLPKIHLFVDRNKAITLKKLSANYFNFIEKSLFF